MRLCAKPEGFVFSVPVRGMSCINGEIGKIGGCRFVSVPVRGMSCIVQLDAQAVSGPLCFRPREGYELHPLKVEDERYSDNVSVPVRGMSCITTFVNRKKGGKAFPSP